MALSSACYSHSRSAEFSNLLDHLVGAQQQRLRNSQAERLGGRDVHRQFVDGWTLDGQISRLGALENLVYVGSGAPGQRWTIRAERHKSTFGGDTRIRGGERQTATQCPLDDLLASFTRRRKRGLVGEVHCVGAGCR